MPIYSASPVVLLWLAEVAEPAAICNIADPPARRGPCSLIGVLSRSVLFSTPDILALQCTLFWHNLCRRANTGIKGGEKASFNAASLPPLEIQDIFVYIQKATR